MPHQGVELQPRSLALEMMPTLLFMHSSEKRGPSDLISGSLNTSQKFDQTLWDLQENAVPTLWVGAITSLDMKALVVGSWDPSGWGDAKAPA